LVEHDPLGSGAGTYFDGDGYVNANEAYVESGEWDWVRTTESAEGWLTPSGGLADVDDREAPNGVSVFYRGRAIHDYSGIYAYSAWTDPVSASWSSDDYWLKCPIDPACDQPVTIQSMESRSYDTRQGVHVILGRTNPVVTTDNVRGPSTGTLRLRFDNDAQQQAFLDLLDKTEPILIQAPSGTRDFADRWVTLGPLTITRAIDTAWGTTTFGETEWTEVDRPQAPVEE
jgi:hypothetical protein